MRSRNARGFTLIEMMVVIGIVALLISIGAPNYMRAREQARQRGAVREFVSWVNQARALAIARKAAPGTNPSVNDALPNGVDMCAAGGIVRVRLRADQSCQGAVLAGPFEIERGVTISDAGGNAIDGAVLTFRTNGTLLGGANHEYNFAMDSFPQLKVTVNAGGFAKIQ